MLIKFGKHGDRVGDSNPRAKYSDAEVEVMRQLREEGMPVREIAEKFECTKGYVSKVCNYQIRISLIMRTRTVR